MDSDKDYKAALTAALKPSGYKYMWCALVHGHKPRGPIGHDWHSQDGKAACLAWQRCERCGEMIRASYVAPSPIIGDDARAMREAAEARLLDGWLGNGGRR